MQVASFSGESPRRGSTCCSAPSVTYLSAGTCFLGFLWALWDEDGLTWHDRLSGTYLARAGIICGRRRLAPSRRTLDQRRCHGAPNVVNEK